MKKRITILLVMAAVAAEASGISRDTPESGPLAWPAITKENMPGTRWWWMGSAVNPEQLRGELRAFRKAGLGTVEITPIYGAKGYENQYIDYLGPKWMEMLGVAASEARKLDMNVDMVTGTGWCFGGPNVGDRDANAAALYGNGAVTQKPSGVKVKRPAPGGEGWMLNLLYPDAMQRYLEKFSKAFAGYNGPKPHAQFHDSYEYKSDWAPDFPDQFRKRRGYDLHAELPALFEDKGDADHVARVKCDYRETVSELIEESIARWTKWSHDQGSLSREQAHGSPGNWLDIYASADIPETEFDFAKPNILVSKFASSAADVTGKRIVGSETGTWAAEHFTETLSRLKSLCDDFFLAGVNRIMWQGTTSSPAAAPWPGWCFYASAEMNPRNAIWHDVPALHAYLSRVQSMMQSGRPDNDVLLYWPVHDFFHEEKGSGHALVQQMSVHKTEWFADQPIGKTAKSLWDRGYAFDYISGKQLLAAKAEGGAVDLSGNTYRAIVVPDCEHMPPGTMRKLTSLSAAGVAVLFVDRMPEDVPGLNDLEKRRSELRNLAANFRVTPAGNLDDALARAGVRREQWIEGQQGLHFVRRAVDGGIVYFIANRGGQRLDQFVTLGSPVAQAAVFDPMSGRIGMAGMRKEGDRGARVHLQLEPGESLILKTLNDQKVAEASPWSYREADGPPVPLNGTWNVRFVEGGPSLPKEFTTEKPGSWTESADGAAQSFAGTALYTLRFDAPASAGNAGAQRWSLDLGKVCQSARVRLNGGDLGTVFTPPFRVPVAQLKPRDNVLEVEVTSTSANRIRDLDLRGVPWKIFHDVNILNVGYKPFDASKWPVAEAGLIGPVTLRPEELPQRLPDASNATR